MTVTIEDIRDRLDKLEALGSPDAIAWELEAQGIKATPYNMYCCAIAQYLGNSPTGSGADHPGPAVALNQKRVICFEEKVLLRTPELVADFITKFDQGAYPALVAEHE